MGSGPGPSITPIHVIGFALQFVALGGSSSGALLRQSLVLAGVVVSSGIAVQTASGEASSGPSSILVVPSQPSSQPGAIAVADALKRAGFRVRSLADLLPREALPSPLIEARARARATLDEMKNLFRTLAIERAQSLLKSTENALVGLLAVEGEAKLLAEISFWLGVFHAAAKNWDEARKRFFSATFLDPSFVVDRSLFPPPIVELFNRARAAHPSLSRSTLSVISSPPGARIFLDGRLVGRAPCTVDLLDGEHVLAAELVAHQPIVARVAGTPSKLETQSLFLAPLAKEALFASLARDIARGSSDFASAPAVTALAKVMAADVVVVASLDATGIELSATSALNGAVIYTAKSVSAIDGAAALAKKLRPPTPPPTRSPLKNGDGGHASAKRMSLKLASGFEVSGGAFEGVAIQLNTAELGFDLAKSVRLIVGAGIAYAPRARTQLLAQPVPCSSPSGCAAGSGSMKVAIPLWIGAAWTLAAQRAFVARFETVLDFSLFSFSDFGESPEGKSTSPGSFISPSAGFRLGPSATFRLSDSWSLAGSAAYRFLKLFPTSLLQQVQQGSPSSAWFESTMLHSGIVSIGATFVW